MLAKRIKKKDGSGGREIQEGLSLTVRSQRYHPCRPVTPLVSRRAGSSHSGFPCAPPSAATTAAAPCSPIQPARVITSAGSRCRFHRSLFRSSQQTGPNPRPFGECHENRFLASSHHAVPALVSPGEVCPTTVPKLDACGEELLTAIVSVAYLALQTCFRCTIASAYQLALGQSIMEAAREVYCLFGGKTGTVTDRPLPGLGSKQRQFCTTSYIKMGTSSRSIHNSESIPYP
jgi:hypothetical protein